MEKLTIVFEWLKEECQIGELCNEHRFCMGDILQWRDQLFSDGAKLFERSGADHVRG